MKKTHTNIALLMMAILVTVVVYASFAYMYYSVDASLVRTFAAREAVQREQAYKNQEKSLSEMYQDTVLDRARLNTFFVSHNKIIEYIETIESLGSVTGATVSLASISADDLASSKPGTRGKISIAIEARGSWSDVMQVLVLAETLPYKTSISGVRLDRTGALSTPGTKSEWRISFVLETVSIRTK